MAFHRFQQLPAELRLHIWECALDESLNIDSLLTNKQKPVCCVLGPRSSAESVKLTSTLVAFEDRAIGEVCREAREVLRRCRQLNTSRNYVPASDVVYVDDYRLWGALELSSLGQVRHVALSADFCYDMLKIQEASPTECAQLGWYFPAPMTPYRSLNSSFFDHMLMCCPKIESITVVIPPLKNDMPYFADHFPQAMRLAFLRIVPYSEIQNIRIKGPYTYTSWLRGSAHTKRRCLGPFIKDVNEVWQKEICRRPDDDDPRRAVTVQAGILQYLEGPSGGKRRLSSIYKEIGEPDDEEQPADQGEMTA